MCLKENQKPSVNEAEWGYVGRGVEGEGRGHGEGGAWQEIKPSDEG